MAALLAALVPVAAARSYTYRGDTPSSKLSGQCAMPGQVAMASSYCCSPRQDLLLLSKQDCEEACSADDNCVAFSWKQELPLTLLGAPYSFSMLLVCSSFRMLLPLTSNPNPSRSGTRGATSSPTTVTSTTLRPSPPWTMWSAAGRSARPKEMRTPLAM